MTLSQLLILSPQVRSDLRSNLRLLFCEWDRVQDWTDRADMARMADLETEQEDSKLSYRPDPP